MNISWRREGRTAKSGMITENEQSGKLGRGSTMPTTKTRIQYEVVESELLPGEYRVEGIDYENDGQVYVAIFSGQQAKERATEYATFKNQ